MSQSANLRKCTRNVSICGEYASGKSTLAQLLINHDLTNNVKTQILFESTFQSQLYSTSKKLNSSDHQEYSINLLDCPGRLELVSQVSTSFRLTDSCIMLFDSTSKLGKYTELITRQISQENIPLLIILENVVFGSVKQGWAFTLKDFAKFYSKQLGMNQEELVEKLWGDYYYDTENGQWMNQSNENVLERGFCQFILKPIRNVLLACGDSHFHQVEELLNPFGVTLSEYDDHSKKELTNSIIMQKWLPASDSIHDLICNSLPSPEMAQQYRAQNLYSGLLSDKFGSAIKNCDPNGPLMIHISSNNIVNGKIYAVGRIFSGSLKSDTLIRIFYSKDVFEEKVLGGMVNFNGLLVEPIEEASCEFNSIVGLVGIEKYLTNKGATITESTELEAKSFTSVNSLNFPKINIYVEPKKQVNLPKIIKGMELIAKCDSSISLSLDEETGEKILTILTESHLNSVLDQFQQLYPNIELELSEPILKYQETVTTESANITFVKTPNKHNRLWLTAKTLQEEISNYIESGKLPEDSTERARVLNERFGWDPLDARKIWSFGRDTTRNIGANANAFVDQTKGVQYLNEIRDSICLGFHIAAQEGPLCNELMRGVRFNLKDVTLHCDALRRSTGQISSVAKRGCYASMLDAQPTLMEPTLLMEFKCGQSQLGTLFSILNERRGIVLEQENFKSSTFGKAYLPVSESFGVVDHLNKLNISSQFIFDHWKPITANSTRLLEIVNRIRLRKGLPEQVPTYTELVDKL
ncbi:predicted protein [Naegleria gruberi]|uniref:Elongation factor 2 n=1 Tax=Naegleria gruberi TaxID=5762 RepID=D2VAA0_NAEGR|nr:uncharacterized protein NAEGRDRAFT_32442 [Naegleria gruberi]EFC46271.1 predicted protein [Naegleria gruberi]|eukprot:XP_002679015.1 predicted protein [Naegleria gruberi strain NEG-M]